MKGFILLLVVLSGFLIASIWFAVETWTGVDDAGVAFTMSWHGWLALVLGVVLTSVLGAALMALTFHSSRSGHDEEVGPES